MAFQEPEEVVQLIKANSAVPTWVANARTNHKLLSALVTGEKFDEVLIQRIEKIESSDRAIARKKYSKNVVDMIERVMNPRSAVFNSFGGSVRNDMSNRVLSDFTRYTANFKGQKSIKKYLSENLFRWMDSDPNALIFIEYKSEDSFGQNDIYPTYKSISDIRNYQSNGQILDWVIFEPKKYLDENKTEWTVWRVVDSETDWVIRQRGENYILDEDRTFTHPFGMVPAVILSDTNKTGSELRISPLFPIVPTAEDYARDKSIKTIYKFQHGFPRHWRYEQDCRACQGTGKTGEDGSVCNKCDGEGYLRVNDVTDTTVLSIPIDSEDPKIAPDVEGFVSPDIETWEKLNDELLEGEEVAFNTMWGTKRVKKGGNETATGRFIDVQPVMIKLDEFTDNAEWIHNQLAHFVESWMNGRPKTEFEFHISYGRRFIIESPDSILERYTSARDKGDNSTILDKLLDEYILSNYRNNPIMIEELQKKRQVEPYIHQSIEQVNDIFGAEEANKVVLFPDFWAQSDKQKTVSDLKSDFEAYVSQDLEQRGLSEEDRTRKLVNQLNPLLATKILEEMSSEQVLTLIGLRPDPNKPPTPPKIEE